jgi:glycosyltransferase involved in cell wall biosynthesis
VEFERFAEPEQLLEAEARHWRQSLGIRDDQIVLLFAGKFQPKKQPTELMRALLHINDPRLVLVLVGDGPQTDAVRELAASAPGLFRVLPFQNQSRMPLVYRLGDVFVLPSLSSDETWGLAVNEAMSCRRPVLVSDLVGCAPDLVTSGVSGEVFQAGDWSGFGQKLASLVARGADGLRRLGASAHAVSGQFTAQRTSDHVIFAARAVFADTMSFRANPTVIEGCPGSP